MTTIIHVTVEITVSGPCADPMQIASDILEQEGFHVIAAREFRPEAKLENQWAFLRADLATVERLIADMEGLPEFASFGMRQRREKILREMSELPPLPDPQDPER